MRLIPAAALLILSCSSADGSDRGGNLFASPVRDPFGMVIECGADLTWPQVADMDGDADLDLFLLEYDVDNSQFHYLENTGSLHSPRFTATIMDPFGFALSGDTAHSMAIADIDGDGDFDMLIGLSRGPPTPGLHFYENTGSRTSASFEYAGENPFGLTVGTEGADKTFITLVDLDSDRDLDLVTMDPHYTVGTYANTLRYYENTGSPESPGFASPVEDAFGLGPYTSDVIPGFGDVDGDGDVDVVLGVPDSSEEETDGGFDFIENQGTPWAPSFEAPPVRNSLGLVRVHKAAVPLLVDIDGDGDVDLLAGSPGELQNGPGHVFYFRNTTN